jgi:hypothetical protein
MDYAIAHQLGDPSRNLPARPMLPPVDFALQEATKVYEYEMQRLKQEAGL